MQMLDTFKNHLQSSNISLSEHVQSRQSALAESLKNKISIYLDVKFWILLRDAFSNGSTSTEQKELLELLLTGVKAGKFFCPISESIFAEIYKQNDRKTRLATARLIDQLSLGVTLIPLDARILMELKRFIYNHAGFSISPSHQDSVWSKLSYVLGFQHPTQTAFDPATELAIQKAFFDHMWSIPLFEIVKIIGDNLPPESENFQKLAHKLNTGNEQHAQELRSFKQTYFLEIKGIVDLVAVQAADIICEIFEKTNACKPIIRKGEEWESYIREWRVFLVSAFKNDQTKNLLRTIHINACLHASIRWNKKRKIEANDFYDFNHASAALGYCDVFLTERSLRAMLTASNTALDKNYKCEVVANISDALKILQEKI